MEQTLAEIAVHETFMRQALAEARRAETRGEVPVGALIVHEGQIIARAHNLTETLTDVTAHAEMQAITSASNAIGGKYLANCTLYVTLEPCVMCAGALAWAQIGAVVFGAPDLKRGFTRFAPDALHPKTKLVQGILQKECGEMITMFFKKKR
ncbi:MAG: nucleoside deaminase [Prevotellaceae bacterium]|jgi:tRNA(adenine34) deaminase|nr:nucleoside deaminase [Prevotellaceae bacterium]